MEAAAVQRAAPAFLRKRRLGSLQGQPDWPVILGKAFDLFFCVLIFATIFFPGSAIYGLNFKYPIYAGLLPLAVLKSMRQDRLQGKGTAVVLAVPLILSLWVLLGLGNDFGLSGVVRQFMDILLMLLMCWTAGIYCAGEQTRCLRFVKLVVSAEIATSLMKILLVAYAVLRGIPVMDMVLWLNQVFGVDLMTMDLGALFGRIQFISDALIPVCLFCILRYRDRLGIGSLQASCAMLLLLISVVLSFSRYFWAFSALAFALGLVLGKRDRFYATLVIVVGLTVVASLPILIPLYQLRFSASVAGFSDTERADQIPALRSFFLEAPLFGHGIGSYTNEVIRGANEAGRPAYEVQLLALPAQIGLVGIAFFVALGAFYYRNLWWGDRLSLQDRLSLGILLLSWIAAGLTNPLLIHPVAGVNYGVLAAMTGISSEGKRRVAGPGSRPGAQRNPATDLRQI